MPISVILQLVISPCSSVQVRVVKPGGKKFSRKERPMGGRKDKEARELALRDQQEVGGVGGCACACFMTLYANTYIHTYFRT